MSKRRVHQFLQDILDAIALVREYVKGHTLETFRSHRMAVDAVVRNLEVIGEAARHIPKDLREKYPEVPWRRVVGFRNVAIHDYFVIDVEIVWTIATEQLTVLEQAVGKMLTERKDGTHKRNDGTHTGY